MYIHINMHIYIHINMHIYTYVFTYNYNTIQLRSLQHLTIANISSCYLCIIRWFNPQHPVHPCIWWQVFVAKTCDVWKCLFRYGALEKNSFKVHFNHLFAFQWCSLMAKATTTTTTTTTSNNNNKKKKKKNNNNNKKNKKNKKNTNNKQKLFTPRWKTGPADLHGRSYRSSRWSYDQHPVTERNSSLEPPGVRGNFMPEEDERLEPETTGPLEVWKIIFQLTMELRFYVHLWGCKYMTYSRSWD